MRYFTPPGAAYNYCIVNDSYINELSSKVWAFENIGIKLNATDWQKSFQYTV